MTITRVYVMRGIPGSGKSHWARSQEGAAICSADDYFRTEDGGYNFDPSKLSEAHAACFQKYLRLLQEWPGLIVVDNTNIHAWEIGPYMLAASMYGIVPTIIQVHCGTNLALKRQLHDVPLKVINRMYTVMVTESLPPFWKMEEIEGDTR